MSVRLRNSNIPVNQQRTIRLRTSAYVEIRQHTAHTAAYVNIRQHTAAYVSIRQHTAAYVSIRQHTEAYVSIRQHTSAYVNIRWHSSIPVNHRRTRRLRKWLCMKQRLVAASNRMCVIMSIQTPTRVVSKCIKTVSVRYL
jgi:hypothetical protein